MRGFILNANELLSAYKHKWFTRQPSNFKNPEAQPGNPTQEWVNHQRDTKTWRPDSQSCLVLVRPLVNKWLLPSEARLEAQPQGLSVWPGGKKCWERLLLETVDQVRHTPIPEMAPSCPQDKSYHPRPYGPQTPHFSDSSPTTSSSNPRQYPIPCMPGTFTSTSSCSCPSFKLFSVLKHLFFLNL